MQTLLLITFIILTYTYLGYGLVMMIYNRRRKKAAELVFEKNESSLPVVSVLIPAFNEEDIIEKKIQNTIDLEYPQTKKYIYVITDGSTDSTYAKAKNFKNVVVLHDQERKGKVGAINRAMDLIHSELTVSTDANTCLNSEALLELVKHFNDPKVAAVSGEKKIINNNAEDATASGEGLYWKYESFLKRLDSNVNTMVGAAGELIAYRTCLFRKIPENSIIEDFIMTMTLAVKGFKVAYEPKAYALESSSASIKEELKRKVRIAAGGFQAIRHFAHLLTPSNFNFLSFQYLSHRVLRWTIAPLSLLVFFFSNMMLMGHSDFFTWMGILHISFYLMATLGYLFKRIKVSFKVLHVPFYFCMMNYAVLAGFIKYLKGNQQVTWEKSVRRA